MKRFFSLLLIGMVLYLTGCVSVIPVNQEDLETTFSALMISNDYIMANRIYTLPEGGVDHVVFLDASNRSEILIHVIVSTEIVELQRDEMIKITPDLIIFSKDMSSIQNPYDPLTDEGFQILIEIYTELIDFNFLKQSNLLQLTKSLKNPKWTKIKEIYRFYGERPWTEPLPKDVIEVAEFVYTGNKLLELHLRREYTFSSTPQKSNYIHGLHFYFSEQVPIEFPSA
jgi:hypothetical protein